MSSNDSPKTRFRRLIENERAEMKTARKQLDRERHRGQYSLETKRQLADAAMSYYDALWEYKEKYGHIEDQWEESGVDSIKNLSSQQVEVEAQAPGDAPAGQTTTRNALVALDPELLNELTKELDKIANELGFAAPAESPLEEDHL